MVIYVDYVIQLFGIVLTKDEERRLHAANGCTRHALVIGFRYIFGSLLFAFGREMIRGAIVLRFDSPCVLVCFASPLRFARYFLNVGKGDMFPHMFISEGKNWHTWREHLRNMHTRADEIGKDEGIW